MGSGVSLEYNRFGFRLSARRTCGLGANRMTIWKIVLFVAPVILSPLVVFLLQMLFPIFLREGAKLFVAMDLPGSMARKVGTDIAVRCVIIFVVSWCAGYGCLLLGWPYLWTVGFAVSGVILALLGTITLVKKKLAIRKWTDASLVGMLAFAGGNIPLFIIIVLMMLMEQLFGSQ